MGNEGRDGADGGAEVQEGMEQHSRGPGSTGSGIWSKYPKENPQTVPSFGHREILTPFTPMHMKICKLQVHKDCLKSIPVLPLKSAALNLKKKSLSQQAP